MTSKTKHKDQDFNDEEVDDLLTQLTAEELELLAKEVDPDVRNFMCTACRPSNTIVRCHQWAGFPINC